MKKYLVLLLLIPLIVWASNKVTDKTEMTDVQGTDIMYIVDDPGGTPADRKITVTNLFDAIDTSAELLAILTDETGTGVAVFGTAPTFTTSITVTGSGVLDADGIDLDTGNAYEINGADINTGGTLSNVAYLDQANTFTSSNTFNGAVVVNETSADVDFRVESDNDANALFVQGSDGFVGMGTATPSSQFHILSSASDKPVVTIENTNEDTENGKIDFLKNSASPADDDKIGEMRFRAVNDNSVTSTFAFVRGDMIDASDGAEAGAFQMNAVMNGSSRQFFNMGGNVGADTGYIIFNENGRDVDFRVESDNDANALFIEGSSGDIGMGTNNPLGPLDVSNSGSSTNIYFSTYSTTASHTNTFNFFKSASNTIGTVAETASGEDLGIIVFKGANSSNASANAGYIYGEQDGAAGATYIPGRISFWVGTDAANPSEAMRVNSDKVLNIGGAGQTEARLGEKLELHTSADYGGLTACCWSTTITNRPLLELCRSKSATIGTHTIVADGDDLGSIVWRGSDGTDFGSGAMINVAVDGTPGNNDMPGAMTFHTSADGSQSPAERMRLSSGGGMYLTEIADADTDIAGKGQVWVHDTTPNELWFTDDAGTDTQISPHPTDAPDSMYVLGLGKGKEMIDKRVYHKDKKIIWVNLKADVVIETFEEYNKRTGINKY